MTLIIPAGYAQVTMNWSSPNFDSGGAATGIGCGGSIFNPTVMEELAAAIVDGWDDNLKGEMDSSIRFDSVNVLTGTDSIEVPVGVQATGDGALAPPNVALLVRKTTTVRGPRGKGRMFWPGMLYDGDVNEDGTLTSGAATSLQAAINGWSDAVRVDNDFSFAILQNSEGQSDFISPPPPVGDLVVQPKAATQRRRLRR